MTQMFRIKILKSNDLLLDELLKRGKTCVGVVKITCYFEVLLERECVVVDSC
jgi:hypothetical protein